MLKVSNLIRLFCCALLSNTLNLSSNPNETYQEAGMSTFSFADAAAKLECIGESQLLNQWDLLNPHQQNVFLNEVKSLDTAALASQKIALQHYQQTLKEETKQEWTPFFDYSLKGSERHKNLGQELIAQGKVGCLLVAGGQGTRLSFDAPKGTFPVSVIKHKSLFQIFAEKMIAAGKQANRLLPLAIMTSPQNHAATVDFFQTHAYFGLKEEQVYFFQQNELPFLDNEGHLILKSDQTIAKGPDGNGGSLSLFFSSGIWENWHRQGVEYVNYILVDNPLADPFDAELIGYHADNHCDITVKCIQKESPEERVGLLVKDDAGVRIVEYTEISDSERKALQPDGHLKHRCTNLSLFCFSMDFIKATAQTAILPWHFAYKATGLNGTYGWKFETYIFDYLPVAKKVKALLYPREECFAPLKNGSGTDSLETVQAALVQYDKRALQTICGQPISCGLIELDQQFHYPTAELLTKWKGRAGAFEGYITPDN